VLALGDGPGPRIFLGPERAPRVDQEDFEPTLPAAEKEKTGA